MNTSQNDRVGAVIIGRNEGERLKRCIASAKKQISTLVYVDSGSSDGSAEYAASQGASVVQLDMSKPFSAGRARNAGFERIKSLETDLDYIQFIDGDCELGENWIRAGLEYLTRNPAFAIVTGRLRERFPGKSMYNELCDVEWNRPIGESLSSGGNFMVRFGAFSDIGGFNPDMIAGEEPELCFRLRRLGWKIYNLDELMALHDANMLRFSQWWKRSIRTGYAYTHRYFLHKADSDRYLLRATVRIWLWAFVLPLSVLLVSIVAGGWACLLLLIYPAQLARGALDAMALTKKPGASIRYALFNIIGRWPQLIGQIKFILERLARKKASIIEYK